MIFLEQTVNQILREEGQVIVTLDDLNITWEDVESLFIGIYEQSKQYISIYDWVTDDLSLSPTQKDYAHIRHLTYNVYFQRMMPDVPKDYYEFNPYTKNASSMINTTFAGEVSKYPTLERLEYTQKLKIQKDKEVYFALPCSFYPKDFSFDDMDAFIDKKDSNKLILQGTKGVGQFNLKTLQGFIAMEEEYSGTLKVTSKYVGIKELDLSCELFYIWFKAALMQYIGAMKKQMDLTGVGLPFDINADGLLERGRQLMDKVEELKGTKQHWSNF